MTVSGLVEHLIQTDDVDRHGRPRWALGRPGTERRFKRGRSTADPTRQVQLTMARSVYLMGRVYAAGAAMTFSGYIEELIRRELDSCIVKPDLALEKTA